MLRLIDLSSDDAALDEAQLRALLPRPRLDITAALAAIEPLMAEVRERGEAALREHGERFDKVAPTYLRVPGHALKKAARELAPELRESLEIAIAHARRAHRAQLPEPQVTEIIPGGRVIQRWMPVDRVGLYVPGGLAVYPSSVVMNVVPAQVAGVRELAVASPAQAEFGGLPHPVILAACALLGITEVYAVGGASAIAMFAYGVPSLCAAVDVITGPGNIYVAAAKRAVAGQVGIDAEAGTTEIAVLADASANPEFVAADLLSQAEHDPAAASVLITPDREFAESVDAALTSQAEATKHHERVIQALTGPQSAIVLTATMEQAIAVTNAYAAEHLEIQVRDTDAVLADIRHAGAIFLGPYSPVPLGDYLAGSNHVLPTGGTARFAAGLNTTVFLRSQQLIEYQQAALAEVTAPLAALAQAEDLPAHGDALHIRMNAADGATPTPANPAPGPLPLRPELLEEHPYGAPQIDTPVRLNVNENPYPPPPEVRVEMGAQVAQVLRTVNRYADREALELRRALGQFLAKESGVSLPPENLWAANGSNEVITHILAAYAGPGRTVMSCPPTYSMYPEYVRNAHSTYRTVERRPDFTLDLPALVAALDQYCPAVVLLASPNNPTGTALTRAELETILSATRASGPITSDGRRCATMVVVDEAYAEFRRRGEPSALELLADNPHLVVTRTMSKAFSCAGLRLGYVAAASEVIDALRIVRLPYHLSGPTQAIARAALTHADALLAQVDELRTRRDDTAAYLRDLGYKVVPSDANFLLFGSFPNRRSAWEEFLAAGVLIREVGPPGFLRVSIGTAEEDHAFRQVAARLAQDLPRGMCGHSPAGAPSA